MGIDLYTKFILSVIALGLLLNGFAPILFPRNAEALVEGYSSTMEKDVKRIVRKLHQISVGNCQNTKIC